MQNIKISAVRSLADICFLHVLYFVFSLYFTMKCFSYVIGVNCVSYKKVVSLCSSFGSATPHATKLFLYIYIYIYIYIYFFFYVAGIIFMLFCMCSPFFSAGIMVT